MEEEEVEPRFIPRLLYGPDTRLVDTQNVMDSAEKTIIPYLYWQSNPDSFVV
jgi:hypothetical protein